MVETRKAGTRKAKVKTSTRIAEKEKEKTPSTKIAGTRKAKAKTFTRIAEKEKEKTPSTRKKRKKKHTPLLESIDFIRLIRVVFLSFIAAFLIYLYYLHTEGVLGAKVLPIWKSYRNGVIIIFGFIAYSVGIFYLGVRKGRK